MQGSTDIGLPSGADLQQDLMALLGGGFAASEAPVHHITDFELWLPTRHTGIFALDFPTPPGTTPLMFITVSLVDPEPKPAAEEKPKETTEAPKELPKGIPVEGKPGFLLSPYAPDKGYVDVTDRPPGTKVACAISGKHFTVPDPADHQILPKETPDSTPASELPVGIPVPEKPGYLMSPYAPDKGYIRATNVPSGAKIQCNYTHKLFRAP